MNSKKEKDRFSSVCHADKRMSGSRSFGFSVSSVCHADKRMSGSRSFGFSEMMETTVSFDFQLV